MRPFWKIPRWKFCIKSDFLRNTLDLNRRLLMTRTSKPSTKLGSPKKTVSCPIQSILLKWHCRPNCLFLCIRSLTTKCSKRTLDYLQKELWILYEQLRRISMACKYLYVGYLRKTFVGVSLNYPDNSFQDPSLRSYFCFALSQPLCFAAVIYRLARVFSENSILNPCRYLNLNCVCLSTLCLRLIQPRLCLQFPFLSIDFQNYIQSCSADFYRCLCLYSTTL